MKIVKVVEAEYTTDFLYDDGSKGYGRVCGDIIHIKRPEVIEYIEDILSKDYTGWSYMPVVEDLFQSGKITEDEMNKIILILD